MAKFLIEYRDPQTGEESLQEVEFVDAADIPAEDWADDYVYSLADKGPYTVTKMKE